MKSEKKLFCAACPSLMGVPEGDIEVGGLDGIKKMLNPAIALWNVHIEPVARFSRCLGLHYHVKAKVDTYRPDDSAVVIGMCNFYEP